MIRPTFHQRTPLFQKVIPGIGTFNNATNTVSQRGLALIFSAVRGAVAALGMSASNDFI
ncbi:MAG: hypothetical protein ABJV68_18440 [Paracoccaceae bacterium]